MGGVSTPVLAASGSGNTYTAMRPVRILDTRLNGETMGANSTIGLQVAGANGVPTDATAVSVNVTVTDTTANSFLTVYPSGEATPLVSNLNWIPGETIANLVVVPVGGNGQISFYNDNGRVNVIVDLQGYFAGGDGGGYYVPLTPSRITDTRPGSGEPNSGKTLGPGGTLNIQVAGAGGMPDSGITAAVLNVTVTDTNADSFLAVYPQGIRTPRTSTLNWTQGVPVANRVIVPLSASGQIAVYNNQGTADVIVDVSGYFTSDAADSSAASLYYPISPTRMLDTRVDGGTLGAGGYFGEQFAGIRGISLQATAIVANLTATDTTSASFYTISPSETIPQTSDLNWRPGVTVGNLSLPMLNSNGSAYIYNNQGSANAVVDVFGYFQPVATAPAVAAAPCTAASLTANGPATVGSLLSVTAQATCPSQSTTYFTYWYQAPSSARWTLAQEQTGSGSFSYNTSGWGVATYQLMVWASSQDGVYQQVQPTISVTMTMPACTGVTVTVSPNPGVVSDPVAISATPQCPSAATPYYVYWARNNNYTTNWTQISNGWTTSSNWLQSTEGWSSGIYSFLVWISSTPSGDPEAQSVANDTLNSSGSYTVSGVTYSRQDYSMNCEGTTLQMALTHEGITIAGNTITSQNDILAAEGVDSNVPGIGPSYTSGDPMINFIGPPNGGESSGYEPGAYYGSVVKAAQHFGGDVIAAGERITPTQVYQYVEENHPVVAWVTFDFQHYTATYLSNGRDSWPWAGPHEHSVLVVGVGVNAVLIDNPWPADTFGAKYGGQNQWVPMSVFESAYSTYNNMAVVFN